MPSRAKRNAGGADVDGAEIDEVAGDIAGAGENVVLDRGARPEMRFVEAPQRLHRNIERAGAEDGEPPALLHQPAQFRRRLHQRARGIEPRDLAVGTGKAEDAFVARDLGFDLADGAPRRRFIGMPERKLGQSAEHLALPVEQPASRHGGADRRDHQRQPGGGRDDPDRAPARQPARRACGCAV